MAARTGSGQATRLNEQIIRTLSATGRITDLPEAQRRWFIPIATRRGLSAGRPSDEPMRIPQPDADRLLKGLVRFVADIPADTSLEVVWERGGDELLVDAGSIGIKCTPGLVMLSVVVSCDQLPRPTRVSVPFGVGRAESPRGLLMSTFTRVAAPSVVAEGWSDAIVAFCWEALLELARRVSAEAGVDRAGRPLIPGAVAAEKGLLLVQPMARHNLAGVAG